MFLPDVCLRCRQTKSKKNSKLDLFGFDDADAHQEGNSADGADAGSNYKIKYFGFDDMSDSDGSDDDSGAKERRRAAKTTKKAQMVAVVEEIPADDDEADEDDMLDPFERLETQERWTAPKENKKSSGRQESRIQTGESRLGVEQ